VWWLAGASHGFAVDLAVGKGVEGVPRFRARRYHRVLAGPVSGPGDSQHHPFGIVGLSFRTEPVIPGSGGNARGGPVLVYLGHVLLGPDAEDLQRFGQ
jgi:hypothetical protein